MSILIQIEFKRLAETYGTELLTSAPYKISPFEPRPNSSVERSEELAIVA